MAITHALSSGPAASVRLNAAAELVLARVVTNTGKHFADMLDLVAADICESVPVCGLEGSTGKYRPIKPDELRSCEFTHGALVMRTRDGAVFTQLAILRMDLDAYFAKLDRLDAGDWPAA